MEIECYPESGSGNGTVSFLAYNTGRNNASKDIRVVGEGVPARTVTINMAGKPLFVQFYRSAISVSHDQTSVTVMGRSNATGLVIGIGQDTIGLVGKQYVVDGTTYNDGDLIAGDPGSTNEYEFSITFTFGQNTGLIDKSASVTVYDINADTEDTVVITQKAIEGPGISLDSNTGIITMTNPFDTGDIFYTIDGTTPTSQSRQYGGPFIINADTSFKLAVIDGNETSKVTQASYTKINPVYSYGISYNALTVRIKITITASGMSDMHYTEAPSVPDYTSPIWPDSVTIPYYSSDNPRRFNLINILSGYIPSDIHTTQEFGYVKPDNPSIAYDADSGMVTLDKAGNVSPFPVITNYDVRFFGACIYYTTDGSTPVVSQNMLYTGPFQASAGTTIKAIIVVSNSHYSDVETVIISNQAPEISQ